ncbi:hypothetical protein ASPTUDRAFT_327590 [Aspergillus tubingensis CBS 134.48]|uniref:Uncharacterized protein n=1 Tax=Aspergillus tubingensis (strain CBS 134.48) TaxID=767770 RepID=A0A1L9NJQ7_ASPTC|nr:hypothetical protein ASPTUDRAFT_327590 [Aspergillus tubingensis CBS 134.48]
MALWPCGLDTYNLCLGALRQLMPSCLMFMAAVYSCLVALGIHVSERQMISAPFPLWDIACWPSRLELHGRRRGQWGWISVRDAMSALIRLLTRTEHNSASIDFRFEVTEWNYIQSSASPCIPDACN